MLPATKNSGFFINNNKKISNNYIFLLKNTRLIYIRNHIRNTSNCYCILVFTLY